MLAIWVLVGLVVGSLVNFLANRLPGESPVFRFPVRCHHCEVPLGFVDLLPIVGYLLRRGECSACRRRIALREPLVEFAAGVVFGAMFVRFGFSWLLAVNGLYAAILLLIFVIDLEHRIILNVVTYPGIVLALALSFATPGLTGFSGLLGGLIYGGIFTALYFVLALVFKRDDALGMGDVKLALFIGLITGMPGAILAAMVGTTLGSLAGLWMMFVRRISGTGTMPYGTALSAGALAVIVWSPWIGGI